MHGTLVNVTPTLDTPRNQYKHAQEAQVAHFVDALRKGHKPWGDAEEILPVMELMDAIYRSAEQGAEVKLG
jgi:predicted dehydrogenase